ncbi:hypothetical protein DdX_10162 [Ditylenchus destructor]|uniref:Uncharacterized protein n=1 Tax=Ditylenchus destructor TaxID=166010 RepID=A0AAD4R2C6_9BILA|nr:hypothetical protein DdX_10162 [Ditylenchus destructor]
MTTLEDDSSNVLPGSSFLEFTFPLKPKPVPPSDIPPTPKIETFQYHPLGTNSLHFLPLYSTCYCYNYTVIPKEMSVAVTSCMPQAIMCDCCVSETCASTFSESRQSTLPKRRARNCDRNSKIPQVPAHQEQSSSQIETSQRAQSRTESNVTKCQHLRRTNFTFFLLIGILAQMLLNAHIVESATFFYGATQQSEQNTQSSGPPKTEMTPELSRFGASAGGSHGKLSDDDLKNVYDFCNLLPMLEKMKQVQKNDQSREICGKLVAMLQPMFAKRKTTDALDTGILRKSRRSVAYTFDWNPEK